MKITREQLERLGALKYEDFLRRLDAKLERQGVIFNQGRLRTLLEDAIAAELKTEDAASIYVECILKLERVLFDVEKVKTVIASKEIDRDHKLIALKRMVFEAEQSLVTGRRHA